MMHGRVRMMHGQVRMMHGRVRMMHGRVPHFPVYLFDIDGTLLDSARDICGAVEQVLRSAALRRFRSIF